MIAMISRRLMQCKASGVNGFTAFYAVLMMAAKGRNPTTMALTLEGAGALSVELQRENKASECQAGAARVEGLILLIAVQESPVKLSAVPAIF